MMQVFQDLRRGETYVETVLSPTPTDGHVIVRSTHSLISVGTERMLVEFGRASIVEKARKQPDKVKAVIDKVRTDGFLTTASAVQSKLAQPIPLGYSNVGVVTAVGKGIADLSVGDRVVSNGPHAEVVRVPRNLCAKIPDVVADDEAVFTVVASIGLQGIRLAEPTIGECFVVIGTGLIGLLCVQLLVAQGCRVLAIDFDESKLALARACGAETVNAGTEADAVDAARTFSRSRGVDGVLIAASTRSNDPVTQAAKMCRKRGRIVLIGISGLELNRADFYEKELSFKVSCSYGPGRYEPDYEEKGQDYPVGFVRWTEQRNFEAVLDLFASNKLSVESLISHRFPFDNAADAYTVLTGGDSALGILLDYPESTGQQSTETVLKLPASASRDKVDDCSICFVGAGNYASRVLIPAFKKAGAGLEAIVSPGGVTSVLEGKKFGFATAATSFDDVLESTEVEAIVIATRHDSHSRLVASSLASGKHVFVEKPLAIDREGLDLVRSAYMKKTEAGSEPILMVGFNRRFSPHVAKISELLQSTSRPKCFVYTVNAGELPSDHWTHDPSVGGGRIIGEACHMVDLIRFLADSKIVDFSVTMLGAGDHQEIRDDKVTISLEFSDGSIGSIHYLANGASSFPKERLEVFVAGRTLQLNNFTKLTGFGWPGFRSSRLMKQDKGQVECAKRFVQAVKTGEASPIPVDEIFEVADICVQIAENIRSR